MAPSVVPRTQLHFIRYNLPLTKYSSIIWNHVSKFIDLHGNFAVFFGLGRHYKRFN